MCGMVRFVSFFLVAAIIPESTEGLRPQDRGHLGRPDALPRSSLRALSVSSQKSGTTFL